MGWKAHECYVSAEAFQAFADLAGLTPREIVRRLPAPGLFPKGSMSSFLLETQ